MEYLLSLLNAAVGNENVARLMFISAIGLCVALAVATVTLLTLALRDPFRRRLGSITHPRAGSDYAQGAPNNLQLMLEQLGQRFTSTDNTSFTRALLTHAGYR